MRSCARFSVQSAMRKFGLGHPCNRLLTAMRMLELRQRCALPWPKLNVVDTTGSSYCQLGGVYIYCTTLHTTLIHACQTFFAVFSLHVIFVLQSGIRVWNMNIPWIIQWSNHSALAASPPHAINKAKLTKSPVGQLMAEIAWCPRGVTW